MLVDVQQQRGDEGRHGGSHRVRRSASQGFVLQGATRGALLPPHDRGLTGTARGTGGTAAAAAQARLLLLQQQYHNIIENNTIHTSQYGEINKTTSRKYQLLTDLIVYDDEEEI